MKLTFLGATKTVTGSKYLVETQGRKVLVDCGLFQGQKDLRLRNWALLPIEPANIDAVFITHAHIDHTGYLPLLVKNGFKGPIYATQGTFDLCSILLPDSGYLQEEDTRRANRYHYSKHHPALPLYTKKDAEIALEQFQTVDFDKPYAILPDSEVIWRRAGHILGSSFIDIRTPSAKLFFTGDMGRMSDPIIKPPAIIQETDYLVLESTYGNRLHDSSDPTIKLAKIINSTIQHGGSVLIPAFAVGRAQSLLYALHQLRVAKKIPHIPIYLDSPMAIDATALLFKHMQEHRLTAQTCAESCSIAIYTRTIEESKAIYEKSMPKIIISASGMMEGGRVLHHLKMLASDSRNTILLTGFQAAGTRGAALLEGRRDIKIHGEIIHVRAQVEDLTMLSAHADYQDILTWLGNFIRPPRKVFITHGEPESALSLKHHIESQLGWNCYIPNYLDKVIL